MQRQPTAREKDEASPAESNDFGHVNAGLPVHRSLTGENPRRNDDNPTRVSAGPLLIGYARVSKADQRLNRQVAALRQAGRDCVLRTTAFPERPPIEGAELSEAMVNSRLGWVFSLGGDGMRPSEKNSGTVVTVMDRSTQHYHSRPTSLGSRTAAGRSWRLGARTVSPGSRSRSTGSWTAACRSRTCPRPAPRTSNPDA